MKNRAIVLGAGVYQLPLIDRLQRRGYLVTTISRDGDYPGFKTADEVFICDITDRDGILKFCENNDIDLIATTGSDVGLPAIGAVNDRFELPGIGKDAARWSASKHLMKDRFLANDVRSAQRRPLEDFMAPGAFRPFVAKLEVSSGSAGVFIIAKPEDFETYDIAAKSNVLFEDYVTGPEFGAQVVITDKVERIFVHSDETYMGSAPVPVGHGAYLGDLAMDVDDLVEQVARASKALGLTDCIANFDFILGDDGCYVLEVGARLGATGLAELITEAHGVDLYDITIDLALGRRTEVRNALGDGPMVAEPKRAIDTYLLFSDRDGCRTSSEVETLLAGHDAVLSYEIDHPPGTPVDRLRKGSDRFGMIVVQAADTSGDYRTCHEILSAVRSLI